MTKATPSNKPILFYDADCLLCSRSIQFILKHERRENLLFSRLDSQFGKEIGADILDLDEELDSAILYYEGQFHTNSEAILKTMQWMDRPFRFLSILLLVPRSLRDWGYKVIAKNRIKWFGSNNNHCVLPNPENQHRFLE